MNGFMNHLSFKGKALFGLFVIFLMISAIAFNFEQMLLAAVSFVGATIFAVLLAIHHKQK